MTTPSTTTFIVASEPASTSATFAYRNEASDRDLWELEAADVRRFTENLPQFDPYAGEPVRVLTDAEQDEARRILAAETVTPQRSPAACPDSSYQGNKERSNRTLCRRAYRRALRHPETGEAFVAFLDCGSRTCPDCRSGLDDSDTGRIAAGLGTVGYVAEIAADDRETVAKRMRRHGATGAFVPSNRDPSRIVVIADEPPTPGAVRIADVPSVVRDLMMTRPTGAARRLTTFGAVESRREWEGRGTAEALDGPGEWIAPTVQPADVENVAEALGIPFETTETRHGIAIRLRVPWDDWRAVALRRWCRNPAGKHWEQMRIDTLIREGAYTETPPDSAYREMAS